ncbi:MAG: HEAT repeat domain-containing protein [Phycisphaerae bacterium]
MNVSKDKRWVSWTFGLIAVAGLAIIGVQVFRMADGHEETGPPEGRSRSVDSLKDLAGALKDPQRREAALTALQDNPDLNAVDMLASLSHQSNDPEVRSACLTALGDIGDPAGEHALTIGSRDSRPGVRKAAIMALGKLGTQPALKAVADALEDTNADVRLAAAEVLADAEADSVTVPGLTKALTGDDDATIRRLAAEALGNHEHAAARDALLSALFTENDPSVRLVVLESLAGIDDDKRVVGIFCALGDSAESVRTKAGELAARLEEDDLPAAAQALRSEELLRVVRGDRGKDVLGAILDTLAATGSAESAPALIEVLQLTVAADDEDGPRFPGHRDSAVKALFALGESSIDPLAGAVLRPEVGLAAKEAAAEIFADIGPSAVPAIKAYLESCSVFPAGEEARIWSGTLERIGGDAAVEAARLAEQRDPAVFFAKYAEETRGPGTRQPAPQLQEFALVLHDGVYSGNPPTAYARRGGNLPFVKQREQAPRPEESREYVPTSRCSVKLDLTRLEDGWDRVTAHPGVYYNSTAFGRVEKAEITDESIEMELRLAVLRDPWMLGGYGEYTVSMRRQEDGSYRGTYTGRYRDVEIEGVATCTEKPERPPLPAGFRPVQPGERPRMLFRRYDLPDLRARLNTPFGLAAFERLASAEYIRRHETASSVHVALGLLYQLTGDASYAARAIPIVEQEMADRDFGFMSLGQVWGGRFSNIALAYDLCYDAWPEDFRARVDRYLLSGSYAASTNMSKFSVCANTHPCSNYFSPIVGGGSMMALAYWMDQGPPPSPPGGTELLEPEPLEGPPPEGSPTTALGGATRSRWLWSGPIFVPVSTEEMIHSLGDVEDEPVVAGRTLTIAGRQYSFKPAPAEVARPEGLYPWLYISREKDAFTGVGMLMYTVLDVTRAGYYSVQLPRQGYTSCRIGDTAIPDNAYVHLRPGRYPLLVAFTGDDQTMVPVGARFEFETDSRSEIDALVSTAADRARTEQLLYELGLEEHKATGMDGAKLHTANMTFCHMIRSHRLLMGTGGYQSEGEAYHHTAITPIRYAAATYNMFGQTLTPYRDVELSVVRHLAHSVLVEDRRGSRLVWQSFNGGNSNGNVYPFLCAGFNFTPEEYKPALLWLWNEMAGVDADDPESYANLFEDQSLQNVIYTFVNYPLDAETGKSSIEPVHPHEAFPRTWQATDKGLYVFRNQWRDTEDIVLQVYANELMSKGHGQPDAGGIRLHGLGHDWTADTPGKGTPYRWLQNVVVIPPDIGMRRRSGRVTHWEAAEDGSGSVTIDMNLVYSGKTGHDAMGIWPPDPPQPGQVSGLRAVAADFSGKSGAPAMFVIVDKIEGGPQRAWLWNTAGVASGDTFTITRGDASLRAVFVAPEGVDVRNDGTIDVPATDEDADPGDIETVSVPVVAKAEPGQSYFVVMTMQEGEAPEVVVESGEGLDAVVLVGRRRIRFDGEKIIIEDR